MPLKRVLITGGAGFLGSHLARGFQNHGVKARIFDLAEPPEWARELGVEYVRGDIRDGTAVGGAMEGVDAVVHAAFASPRMAPDVIESVNVQGTQETSKQALAHGVKRFVLISSTVVQRSARAHPLFRSAGLSAMDVYRETRTRAERRLAEQCGERLSLSIVRPKTFVGPGRVSAFTIVFEWIRQGRPVLLLGPASCRYQLLEIRDMAEGIRLLTESNAQGQFSFGAHRYASLREDLQSLIDHAATGSRLRMVPGSVARAALRGMEFAGMVPPSELHYMSAWNTDSVIDTSRAVTELGWQPQWSNAEALRNAYDWYVQSMETTGKAQSIHALPGSHKILRSLIDALLR